jgi:hypothetical protein
MTDAASGTIFRSPWFALERPAFDTIADWSESTLSMLLILSALVLVYIALNSRIPTIIKAVVLAYILLP